MGTTSLKYAFAPRIGGSRPQLQPQSSDRQWAAHRSFQVLPDIAWNDPNVRFVDLDGDAHADVLVSDGEVFTIHTSLGEDG